MSSLWQYLDDFTHLLFPFNCYGCGRSLDNCEKAICTHCREALPRTKYWLQRGNAVEKLFWAKVPIESACAFLFFTKGGVAQALIHQLKYKGKTEVGEILGRLFAEVLSETPFREVDVIVPVPLHASKRKKRGYNQCDYIGRGVAVQLDKPLATGAVSRLRANETQTRKGVYERWINVRELFRVTDPGSVAGKHVLLIDDVVTTGSTLEACADALLQVPGTKVSLATLACPAPY